MRLISIVVCLLFVAPSLWAAPTITPKAPRLAAEAWVLMDYESGQIIAQHNADKQLPPASLTKMMTSYAIAHEIKEGNISEQDMVTVSENAWASNPKFNGTSLMWIEVGKQVSVAELHKGIIIQSGNDATVAMAEYIAGSESGFAAVMNYHAERLGMTSSHFGNSHGLPGANNVSTARDLAVLGQALIRDFPEEYAVYAEPSYVYNNITQYNRNELLSDPSLNVDGIKTGFTDAAGYCLVASAQKDGMRLISVVLGTNSKKSRKQESKKLLTYGFRYFETVSPIKVGETLYSEKVWLGDREQVNLGVLDAVKITIPKGQRDKLKASMKINGDLEAPISKGQEVGQIVLKLGEDEVLVKPLIALHDVAEGGFFSRMMDHISRKVSSWF